MKTKIINILLLLSFLPGIVSSQFYFFGRNKVQYEDFEWQVLKTEHFNIYYYEEFEEMAEIGAQYAEDAYNDLKVKFNHVVTNKIPLIFYNTHLHFQQTNTRPDFIPEGVGGFYEFLKGRVVVPYLGNLYQFRHVIRHELVHVFMMSKVYNVLTDHRIPINRYPHLWFIEGLAEYWSYEWDTQAEMVMRDAVINNLFTGLKNINNVYGSFLMYKFGQNFLHFASEYYGEDKILQLLENIWRFDRFDENIEYAFGQSIEDIDDRWEYYLRQKYFPLYSDLAPHKILGNKITESGFNFSPAYLKLNEKNYVFFIANKLGYTSLYKMELDEKYLPVDDEEVLIRGESEEVFEAFHLLKPSLTASKKGLLAFITKSGGTDAIHLYDAVNDNIIDKIQFKNLVTIEAPQFSNSDDKIIFSAVDRKGFSDLFTYSIHNKELVRLTNDYYSDTEPVFSHDDDYVVFSSDRTEGIFAQKKNLFKYEIKSGSIDYLTYTGSDFSTPRFSPENGVLYFKSDYDGNFNIWHLEKDGNDNPSGMTRVTNFLTSVFEFTFTEESKLITSAIEKFTFQFYNVNLAETKDSASKFVAFNYDMIGSKWIPDKISGESLKEKMVYENDYTLDYAVSQVIADPVYGARGGALMTLSDLLGDDQYVFLIYNTAEVQSEILKQFNVAISRVNFKQRTNFGYGIFHFNGKRYDIRESEEYFDERAFGGYFSFVYPFSTFQRIESSVSIANSDKSSLGEIDSRKALLVSNSLAFVHDNSLWGPTGPLDGSRFRLLLAYTSDVKYSNVNFYSVIADYRKYFRISRTVSLASRASIFYNEGKEARRYFAGGSWDLRGWKRFSIRGEKLWLSSLELRYPLIDRILIDFPFMGIGFAGIRGAAFFDAGSAWDDEYKETLGSMGVGLRINFLNAITFRYDIGKKLENNFSKVQESLFYQFFFGWDF
ncbi:MAG: BamA/TamA family outer membrane protein [Bacteroidota bacterium]